LRASTLFAITVAALLGLGAAVAAKAMGLFNRSAPPPPPPKEEIQVLVPTHNLFEGFTIQAADVKTRPLRADEMTYYKDHKDDYLPPVPQAAVFRVARKNIEAESPLFKQDLHDLTLAEPINQRLLPNMRALNVAVNKDFCAGGLIQVGDWVDVHLTSKVETAEGENSATHTANLAHYVRVIAKRNILWPVLQALPDDHPVNFTLEANPYRAALIEFARTKGQLTLVSVPAREQQHLEEQRQAVLKSGKRDLPTTFSESDSAEYRNEDDRVAAFVRGELTVGDTDLIRIFGITTPPPPKNPVTIQMYSGVEHDANVIFAENSGPIIDVLSTGHRGARAYSRGPNTGSSVALSGLTFRSPDDSGPKKCKTCGKKK
jgi:Flp pilus assembly protein CpaB